MIWSKDGVLFVHLTIFAILVDIFEGSTNFTAVCYPYEPLCEEASVTSERVAKDPEKYRKIWNGENGIGKFCGGHFPVLLQRIVRECTGRNVTQTRIAGSMEELDRTFVSETFAFPVSRSLSMHSMEVKLTSTVKFLPVIYSPGVLYIGRIRDLDGLLTNVLIMCWPLLAIIFVTAAISGIFIWMFDSHWNPKDFPRPFLQGYWEGVWWAFITMTTVGYGDRAPKSVPGRIYSCLWILYGVCIIAVFTATLTTTLNTEGVADMNLHGKKIGVKRNSHEHHLAMSMGATVCEYGNLDKLKTALILEEELDGILLESIQSLNHHQWIERYLTDDIEIKGEIKDPLVHGILARDLGDSLECFVEALRKLRPSQITELKYYYNTTDKDPKKTHHGEGLTTLLIFNCVVIPIYVLLVVWVVVFTVALLWDCFYLKPRRKSKDQKDHGTPTKETDKHDHSPGCSEVKGHSSDI